MTTSSFYKQLYVLSSLVIEHCVDNKRTQHIKKCWEKLTADLSQKKATVANVANTFNSLQALTQAMCQACEAYKVGDITIAHLKKWANTLNNNVLIEKQKFLKKYIDFYHKNGSDVYYKTYSAMA